MKKQITWINFAKFLAIMAVMVDHTEIVLYKSRHIAYLAYFNVSLFIFIMGVTTFYSFSNSEVPLWKKVVKKIYTIGIPYCFATFIYFVFLKGYFDFEDFLQHLFHFNIENPFYYVFLYIQLAIISPVVFIAVRKIQESKLKILWAFIGFVIVLTFASLSINHTNMMGLYGGGGKLFGGTHLMIMYLGMLFAAFYTEIKRTYIAVIGLVIAASATVFWWNFISYNAHKIDDKLPFGEGLGCPSFCITVYMLLVTSCIIFFDRLMQECKNRFASKVYLLLTRLGTHTLYIFLYHRFFIDVIASGMKNYFGIVIDNMWLKRVVYFAGMIGISLGVEWLEKKVRKVIKIAYSRKSTDTPCRQ